MNNLTNYFERLSNNGKLSHSFLIGNTNFDEISNELLKIINKLFFKNITDDTMINNPDLYILRPINGLISKDRIKELINNLSKTSQFYNNKVYIIEYTEKLNDFAYNSILKTLEEPKDNIYAFLLTSNIDSVKSTISSRCQKIFISTETTEKSFDDNIINIGNQLINNIESYQIDTFGLYPELYNDITDRNMLIEVLEYLLKEYFRTLNDNIFNKDNNSIIKNNSNTEQISRKILVINNTINNLNYFLSKNIAIDRFIIEMWRCNNENS